MRPSNYIITKTIPMITRLMNKKMISIIILALLIMVGLAMYCPDIPIIIAFLILLITLPTAFIFIS